MGEGAMKVTGLLPKISSLFNNHLYSDVEFVFMSSSRNTPKIYGHKLILALRSKVFASMFFDTKESLCEVRLPASKKSSFSHLLRFLYTDDVQFHTFEEAQELFELADEYAVEELVGKCSNYLLCETLTIENIFPKYECALKKNIALLLKDCQDFVCSNTHQVLEPVHFTKASVKVVEDIVKLDNLSVQSELEIIGAVLKWGSEELKRNKISPDEKYLRKCIDPFMKHMRFLTLSLSEFEYFIENFNIFTGYESSILTRKMYYSHCIVNVPESLCPIITKRARKDGSKAKSHMVMELNEFRGSSPQSTSPVSSLQGASPISVANDTSLDLPSEISSPVSYNSTNASHLSDLKPSIQINAPLFSTTSGNKISYQVKKNSPNKTNVTLSHLKRTKFNSSPNLGDKIFFPPGVLHASRFREFDFSLLESQPCLGTSFPKDVKCSVFFKMKAGKMDLYGFELKIKKNHSRSVEEFEIDVDLRGFSKQSFSHQFNEELKDNILTVKFPEKMVLKEGSKGVLDVSIDNLLLDRCSICDINDKGYELNIGLNFACEILLSSTQKTDDNYIFLISKLIYVPH